MPTEAESSHAEQGRKGQDRPVPVPPSGRQVALSAHDQELVVVEVGGGIRSYRARGRPVLDGYAVREMCSSGRGQILAPWPNRLAGGSFEWAGSEQHTPLSEADRGNAIHGLVRWSAWQVEDLADGQATLSHVLHPQPGWPWRLHVRVGYSLREDGLRVRSEVTNQSGEPAPFGLGWHPYLHAFGGLVDDVALRLPVSTVYQTDAGGIPTGSSPVAGTDLDFRAGRRVGPARLDTCFTGLERRGDGRAVVQMAPAAGGDPATTLWVDGAYTHLMVYSGDTLGQEDRRRRALAVEPMTCAPNALRSGDGLLVLEPGETVTATWGIEPG